MATIKKDASKEHKSYETKICLIDPLQQNIEYMLENYTLNIDIDCNPVFNQVEIGTKYILAESEYNSLTTFDFFICIICWNIETRKVVKFIKVDHSTSAALDDNHLALALFNKIEIWDLDKDQLLITIKTDFNPKYIRYKKGSYLICLDPLSNVHTWNDLS